MEEAAEYIESLRYALLGRRRDLTWASKLRLRDGREMTPVQIEEVASSLQRDPSLDFRIDPETAVLYLAQRGHLEPPP